MQNVETAARSSGGRWQKRRQAGQNHPKQRRRHAAEDMQRKKKRRSGEAAGERKVQRCEERGGVGKRAQGTVAGR